LRGGHRLLPRLLRRLELADVQRRRQRDQRRRGDHPVGVAADSGGSDGGVYDTTLRPDGVVARRSASVSCTSTRSAISWNARACGLDGSAATIGNPLSPASRTARASGTSPRNGMPISFAIAVPPPWPNSSARAPQPGQRWKLMFSI